MTGRLDYVIFGLGLAFFLWFFSFLMRSIGTFWYRITVSAAVLAVYASLTPIDSRIELRRPIPQHILLGAVSGLVLYILFYIGFKVFEPLIEGGAGQIYAFRSEASTLIIALLLLVTSFCEEYFWREYVQRALSERHGHHIGIAASTAAYALIHAPTLNAPLILAAFIAGLFWAVLYASSRSLWMVVASHMVWTEFIFVLSPLA